MAEHTNDMFYTFDAGLQRFTFMSGACYEVSGFTADEYLKMTSLENVLPPHSLKIVGDILQQELEAYQKGGRAKTAASDRIFELQQYHKDGHLIWVEISTSFIYKEETSNLILLATSRHIDSRKKAELALRESDEKYNTISEHSQDAI
jgi:PAS domain S-box-containing protein